MEVRRRICFAAVCLYFIFSYFPSNAPATVYAIAEDETNSFHGRSTATCERFQFYMTNNRRE